MIKMKAIVPGPFKDEQILKAMINAVHDTIKEADKEFSKTYATWSHKPKFVFETPILATTLSGIRGAVYTTDQIYVWLNDGTRKNYKIPKQGPGLLAFPSGYTAKTSPGVIGSRSGGPSGEKVIIFGQVTHPGIDARKFDEVIGKRMTPKFYARAQKAMAIGAKASGHAI